MKKVSLIIFIIAMTGWLAGYGFYYWAGFRATTDPLCYLFFLLPVVPVAILALIIIWISSFFFKKWRLWTTSLILGLFVFAAFARISLAPAQMAAYGVRDWAMRNYSLDDLRHFARDFDRLPHKRSLEDGDSYYPREDLALTDLPTQYPFLTGPPDGPGAYERDGLVTVLWGGALVGHWGFSVTIDGKKGEFPHGAHTKVIPEGDDIAFISRE